MDILKHGPEVEIKAPELLRKAVIEQIAAVQKFIQNKEVFIANH